MKRQCDTLVNGMKIHSLVAGSPQSPPLVLLHGYPTNAYLWRRCIPGLAEHFRVYAPDLPGHGDSDKPLDAEYDLDYFLRFLVAYFSVLNLPKAHLAVHDLGGAVGLGFASRNPEMVEKLIVMDSAPYKEWSGTLKKVVARARSPIWSQVLLCKPVFGAALRDVGVYCRGAITAETAERYRRSWVKNRASRKAFSRVICAPPEAITERRENLRRIKSPTLILWGQNDRMMGTDTARELASDIPGSQLKIIPSCGHFLQEDNPEAVTENMLKFLADVE
ncbi:MAG: alpha/beta hydrolase [Desulfobacteraceae bacterium]|nr:alpha/beta hydrolase [Desulfobacteraceae bacterium]